MKQNKILIILAYYERPNLVENALNSIIEANKYYTNWNLFFRDDASPTSPGEPIVRKILAKYLDKVTFFNSNQSAQDKLERGWDIESTMSKIFETYASSPPDIVTALEDDNELFPSYLYNLNSFFNDNPDSKITYSNMQVYNPLHEKASETINYRANFNQFTGPIDIPSLLEIGQMAMRWEAFSQILLEISTIVDKSPVKNITSNMPVTTGIAKTLGKLNFLGQKVFDKHGPAKFTGFVSQYKGSHSKELIYRHFSKETLFFDKSSIDA